MESLEWAKGTNIYEVNIRQYTPEGSFHAFAKHLPRLKDMGVEILWLMPVTPISMEKRLGSLGSYYACGSYTAINPEFGTMDDFKDLVQQVHTLGMKIIIDWVANHTGWDHEWTKDHADWYVKDEAGNFTEKNGWKDVIDLDYAKSDMCHTMIAAMQFWIRECNIDGFRCDMAHLVPLDFWKEARKQCDAVKKLFWLAECEVPAYHEVFDISYAWDWMHVSEKVAKGTASIGHMENVLMKYQEYPAGAKKLFFTSNHDENSWNGTEYEKYGNGAKAFAVFTCTWPGIPLIYSGQELPNHKRLKFFDKDLVEWNEHIQLHKFYQLLLQLRKLNAALLEEADLYILSTGFDDKVFAYLLARNQAKILVLLNLSPADRVKFAIENKSLKGNYANLFSGIEYSFTNKENFELHSWGYLVYVST